MLTRCLTALSCAAALLGATLLAGSALESAAAEMHADQASVKVTVLSSWGWD
ncbi:hypothetical protein [Streptomyces sp. MMG1121]|uniref:hypothetical protein n=1 Tax=Streptomyces sp. MMG1121 TaxID=1415544 RepID=UPI000B2207B7|nr:hypothetical protein [Streptomyces sp. MMG1121]